jgi:hypothetical protein
MLGRPPIFAYARFNGSSHGDVMEEVLTCITTADLDALAARVSSPGGQVPVAPAGAMSNVMAREGSA